jgi:2Fe-2S ferredoxin
MADRDWRGRAAAPGAPDAPRRRDRLFGALQQLFGRPAAPPAPPRLQIDGGPAGPVDPGTTALRAALELGVDVDHFCGGKATCSSCRVEVLEGADHLSPMSPRERMVLGPARAGAGDRLACQAQIRGPVRLRVPARF